MLEGPAMKNAAYPVPDLLPTAVHLWRIPLVATPDVLETYCSLLAPDERDRAARFHFDIHRHRFVIGRARLRVILGAYLKSPPQEISFSYTEHGKPYVSKQSLTFNLSHAEETAVLGVTSNLAIGVDIEHMRRDLTEGLAERYFAPAEVRALRSFPPEQQPAAFFRCWTRKEAYIKARGEGLSMPLAEFEVPLVDHGELSLMHYKKPLEAARWSLRNVPVPEGYVAAVVVEGHNLSFEHFDWNDPAA